MTTPTLVFFSNKGGTGRTSLVYHTAWMYADLGYNVLAVDLDPQMDLTVALLGEDRVEALGAGDEVPRTIYDATRSMVQGQGALPTRHQIARTLSMIAGDLSLSSFEDELARAWRECLEGQEHAFRVTTALWRSIQQVSSEIDADVVLMDVAPSLGAINRAALIASDHIVIPVTADPISVPGLDGLGTAIHIWRQEWTERLARNPEVTLDLPTGQMQPAGYVMLRHVVRLDRPAHTRQDWLSQIPHRYATAILHGASSATRPDDDPNCLGIIRRYDSLISLSLEAGKPIFHLKPSDGAVGSQAKAVVDARREYEALARKIASASWLPPTT